MNIMQFVELELATVFELVAGLAPKVTIIGSNDQGRAVIAVAYRGDEMVRAMQIEAYVVEQGESIRHRSQLKEGNTILVYEMGVRKGGAGK